ncbi:hypothetical protein [Vibrio sp. SCSIO 43155]|uniref:hypothetical protein n=1 Tax=Vibrio TaxID=662 RepID=UPI002076449F|nr:hypothetical protein [Vibrio sp. SCSIO 43155]USD58571.1 hypothetical protein J4N44_26835 [Vibrio sp. SCSIO 43155]
MTPHLKRLNKELPYQEKNHEFYTSELAEQVTHLDKKIAKSTASIKASLHTSFESTDLKVIQRLVVDLELYLVDARDYLPAKLGVNTAYSDLSHLCETAKRYVSERTKNQVSYDTWTALKEAIGIALLHIENVLSKLVLRPSKEGIVFE